MTAKTLCLVLFDSGEADWLVPQAAALARGLDAHLTALHSFRPMIHTGTMGADPIVFSSMLEWEEQEAERIRRLFEETCRREDIRGDYRAQEGFYGAEAFLCSAARGAEVVIFGTNAGENRSPDDRTMVHRLIRELGRPVLVMPGDRALERPAARVVIGWTDTREAARAAHDARLLAAPGAEIEIVTVAARAGDAAQGLSGRDDLAAGFDRAGFKVTLKDRLASADQRAETLLRTAEEAGADLLVTGAFGHSQVYDMLVGAVTRDLLETAPLPVLLSH
jgi:nucleotide-binding universal stress UspA family protein